MDRERFRSTGGRDGRQDRRRGDEYEEEGQYVDEHEAYDDDEPRPQTRPRQSRSTPSRRVEGTRRDIRETPREGRYDERQRASGASQEPGEYRSRRPREDYDDYYEERRPSSRPSSSRPRRGYPEDEERYESRPRRPASPGTRSTSYARPAQRTGNSTRQLPPSRSQRTRYEQPRRRRGFWSFLFLGCGLGLLIALLATAVVVFFSVRLSHGGGVSGIGGLGGTKAFQKSDTQNISLSALSQLQICDTIGDVSVTVDQNATATTLTTTRIVQATSQANANQEFGRIGIAVQQPASLPANPTCATTSTATGTPTATSGTSNSGTNGILTIQSSIPNSDSLIRTSSDAVNMQLTLSPQAFAGASALPQLYVEASTGNVTVNGLSGILNIRGNSGNVTVTNAKLINGSHIGTGQGNVTFNGSLASPQDTTTNASFVIQDEKGQIDVTLPTTTNVVLSANTNVGSIHSDFPITPTNDGNSSSFRGPLNSAASIQSIAVLTLNVSTGNITIHKTS